MLAYLTVRTGSVVFGVKSFRYRSRCVSVSFSNKLLSLYIIISLHDRISSQEGTMSSQRRHAHNFIDSLASFRQTLNDDEINEAMSQASSENNRVDHIRSKQNEDDKRGFLKHDSSRDSVILAGHLDNQQCTSLIDPCNIAKKNYNTTCSNSQPLSRITSTVSDETSYLSIKPDLNKCINLFRNEYLIKECDSLEKQLNTTLSETTSSKNIDCHSSKNTAVKQQNFNGRPRSMSTDSLKKTVLLNQELRKSKSYSALNRTLKRDTNYNIKANRFFPSFKSAIKISHDAEVETIVPIFNALSLSKPLSSKKYNFYSAEDDQRPDSTSEKSSKEELDPNDLKTFLRSLGDKKSLKEAAPQQRLLRRLSANCYDSPKAFTEGLLTIIEESVINTDSLQCPEISLQKFNNELKKMSKFIEDETVPEWPQSPGTTTPKCAKRKSQESKSNLLRKSLSFGNSDKDLYLMLISPRCNINKTPKKVSRRMSKNTSYTTKHLHDSTNTFENLEAYCEELYSDENETLSAREKTQLQSPFQHMDNIRRACESQMASLNDSFNIHEEIKKAAISDSANQHNKIRKSQNLQQRLVSYEKDDRTESKKVSDMFKQRTKRSERHKMIELDDFENTLMYEIAKKRQRCLDTAKILMEIDAESTEATEGTEETYPNIVIDESLPTTNDDKFMKVLMCMKKYQDYLEKHKSLLSFLHRTKLNSPRTPRDRKDVRAQKMSNEKFGTCTSTRLLGDKSTLRVPRLSPRKKSTSPLTAKHHSTNKTVVSKPKLFMTPGKTPVKRSKRTYFPNMLPNENKQDKSNINPHVKIYQQVGNYDHVISPVGMYIRGKESYLKTNRQTDEMLLTPKTKNTPNPKFQLSSKRPKEKVTGITTENKNSKQGHTK